MAERSDLLLRLLHPILAKIADASRCCLSDHFWRMGLTDRDQLYLVYLTTRSGCRSSNLGLYQCQTFT
jgi:hypothetical protein